MKVYRLDINPDPWTPGNISTGRKGGKKYATMYKDMGLTAYQEAVKAALAGEEPEVPEPWQLDFFFWRELEEGVTAGRRRRGHVADATNMQKALEDALQGVLIGNDRDVRKVGSEIVEQGFDVEPGIVIVVSTYVRNLPAFVEQERHAMLTKLPAATNNRRDYLRVDDLF